MQSTVAIIAAIGLPSDLMNYVKDIAKRFQRLNHIPVRIIDDSDVQGLVLVKPHFARYYAWCFVPPETNRIIYMDYDILPVRALPPPPDTDFAAISENSICAGDAKKKYPLLGRADTYFNSGFFVAKRSSEIIFDRMIARQSTATGGRQPLMWDQTLLNVEVQTAVEMKEISFKLLSNKWCMAFWDLDINSQPCMVHYIAMSHRTKVRVVGTLSKTLDQLESQLLGG